MTSSTSPRISTTSTTHRLDLLANPLAPSLRVYEALSSDMLLRRPTPLLEGALVERIAAMESIPTDWIAIGSGIDDLIVSILRAFGGPGNLVLFPPSDLTVEDHAARLGIVPVRIPRSMQFTTDLDRAGLPGFPPNALTYIQHPNDPTGSPTTVHDAVRMIRRSRLLVIDERHGGYGARSLMPLVREFDRVIVLRTFETWAGLTSLPVAVAIGAPDVIQAIQSEQMIRVSPAPLIAAHATLDDLRGMSASLGRVKDEKARMYRMLRKLNMVRPMPSWANFVLVRTERGEPRIFLDELLRRDIRVHVPEQLELDGFFRISAGSHEATAALRAALIELAPIL